MLGDRAKKLSRIALAGAAFSVAACQATHEATVQSFQVGPDGKRVATSKKVGVRVQAPALASVEMGFRNLSVDEQLAHLQQRLNDALRHIGRADCVNSFLLECPNVKGDHWIAEGVKIHSPSLTAFLIDKGIDAAGVAAFWKFAHQNFGDSFSIDNNNNNSVKVKNHIQNTVNPGTPVNPPKPDECPNKNGCPSLTLNVNLKNRPISRPQTFTA